jgi:hypothetical protein
VAHVGEQRLGAGTVRNTEPSTKKRRAVMRRKPTAWCGLSAIEHAGSADVRQPMRRCDEPHQADRAEPASDAGRPRD